MIRVLFDNVRKYFVMYKRLNKYQYINNYRNEQYILYYKKLLIKRGSVFYILFYRVI